MRKWWRQLVAALGLCVAQVAGAYGQSLGDANCDASVDESDLAAVTESLFEGTPACNGVDANLDWTASAADLVMVARQQGNDSAHAVGPRIQYFGLAAADGSALTPIGELNGAPVYFRSSGFGVRIVLEGVLGESNVRPGVAVFEPAGSSPTSRPDVQIEASRDLGDGSSVLCDGGIAATVPANFGDGQAVTDSLNDVACGATAATSASFACTQNQFGSSSFVSPNPFVQFCVQVSRDIAFRPGDTILTARLRDLLGNLGPERRMIVRIGVGAPPATFTVTPTRAPASPSASKTPTSTFTLVPTETFTSRPSSTASLTPTRRPTSSPTPPATLVATATPTRPNPSSTPTTPESTPSGPTRTRTATRTPTRSPTVSATPVVPRTVTPTVTATTAPLGPSITYFGLALADDTPMTPTLKLPDDTPVFAFARGLSFAIVIEAKAGSSGVEVGCLTYRPSDAGGACTYQGESALPDLQVVVSQPLGNGSPDVCDTAGSAAGGVPAVDPPAFDEGEADPINDLGCRFVNGGGEGQPSGPLGRKANDACTSVPPTGDLQFVNQDESTIQFCTAKITRAAEFPLGDTTVTARVRDQVGNVGPPRRIVVRVNG